MKQKGDTSRLKNEENNLKDIMSNKGKYYIPAFSDREI